MAVFVLLSQVDNWASFVLLNCEAIFVTHSIWLSHMATRGLELSSIAVQRNSFPFCDTNDMYYVTRGLRHLTLTSKNTISAAAKTSFVTTWRVTECTAYYYNMPTHYLCIFKAAKAHTVCLMNTKTLFSYPTRALAGSCAVIASFRTPVRWSF